MVKSNNYLFNILLGIFSVIVLRYLLRFIILVVA